MWRVPVGWSKCFEDDGLFVVVAWGIAVDWVVESQFGEVRAVSCLRVCGEWRLQVDIVVAEAQAEVVDSAVDADVVLQQHRMELDHCAEEGSLEVRMAVVGIVVLRDD